MSKKDKKVEFVSSGSEDESDETNTNTDNIETEAYMEDELETNDDMDEIDAEDEDKDKIDSDKGEEEEEEDDDDADDEYDENGDCIYKSKKKPEEQEYEEDEYLEEDLYEEPKQIINIIKGSDRETLPLLTKYEKSRVLGIRSAQLSNGAKPMIKDTFGLDVKEIARLELIKKVNPLIIHRPMPDGNVEEWYVRELDILE